MTTRLPPTKKIKLSNGLILRSKDGSVLVFRVEEDGKLVVLCKFVQDDLPYISDFLEMQIGETE